MLKERRLSRQKHVTSETCESLPRSLPKKVQQETIKRNYQQLLTIPIIPYAESIKHLYLSHNKIANLKGIQVFVCLENLNVSYNNLQRVQQLRRISNPLLLKHLKIRMNPLPFGYQDYAVGLFQNLKTFEDISFKQQSKQHLRTLRNYVSKNILQFMKRIKKLGEALQCNDNKQNIEYVNRKPKKQTKKISLVDLNNDFINKLKAIYTFPNEQNLRNISIGRLLSITSEIIQITCQSIMHVGQHNKEQYLFQTKNVFQEIRDMILLKYSARHDKTLITHLQQIKSQNKIKNYNEAFSRLGVLEEDFHKSQIKMQGGAIKSSSLNVQSAKYIRKIDTKLLTEHPMNRLANWQQPNVKTLIPLQQTKWYNFYNKNEQEEDWLFQQVPMLIYCKYYLEIVSEIVLTKVSQILNKEREIVRFRQFEININKQQIIIKPVEQQIQFSLTKSDVLSFGNQQNQTFNLDKTELIQQEKAGIVKGQLIKTKQRTYPKPSLIQLKQVFSQDKNFAYNVDKYNLYQINLAYKVLRSLKKRVIKKKQKRALLY